MLLELLFAFMSMKNKFKMVYLFNISNWYLILELLTISPQIFTYIVDVDAISQINEILNKESRDKNKNKKPEEMKSKSKHSSSQKENGLVFRWLANFKYEY